MKLRSLHPPFRFAHVEQDVLRGSYPKQRNLDFLATYNLTCIVSLIPKLPVDHLGAFCTTNNIHLVHIPVAKPKEDVPLSFTLMNQLLLLITDTSNHPLYMHCMDGTIVTGLVVACLRRLQGWRTSSAVLEYSRYVDPEADERRFIERYPGDFTIPDRPLPNWLETRVKCSLRVRYERDERAKSEQKRVQDQLAVDIYRQKLVQLKETLVSGKAVPRRLQLHTADVSLDIKGLALHGLDTNAL